MTDTNDKIRGLFLAALMVMSVFAMTVAFSGSVAAAANIGISGATEYQDSANNHVIEVTFNNTINSAPSGLNIWVDENKNPNAYTVSHLETGTQVVRWTIGQDVTPNQNLTVEVTGISGPGGSPASVKSKDITVTSQSIQDDGTHADAGDAINVYQGEPIALVSDGNTDQDITINQRNGGVVLDGGTGAHSEVLRFNTESLTSGATYRSTFESTNQKWFNISSLNLDATLVNSTDVVINENAEVDISAIRGNSDVTAKLIEPDGDEEDVDVVTLDGSGEATAKLSASTADDYTIEVIDNKTGVTVSTDDVTFIKEPDEDVSFSESTYSDQRGDVINITIEFDNTDEATLSLGNVDDAGHAWNATVIDDDDDGEATVQWNTFLAGSGTVSGETDIEDDIINEIDYTSDVGGPTPGDIISAGTYDIDVRTGANNEDQPSDAVATVTIEERNSTDVNTWTAPGPIESDIDDLDAVYERVGINITEDSSIASGDLMVTQIQASGLEGAIRDEISNGPSADVTAAFGNLESQTTNGETQASKVLSLTLNQTNAQLNRNPKTTDFAAAARNNSISAFADYENDTYFVVWDADDSGFTRDYTTTTSYAAPSDGDQFDTNFTVLSYDTSDTDYGLVAANEDGDFEAESLMSAWDFVDSDWEINLQRGDIVRVRAQANQTISGTTDDATGSEATVRLQTVQGASNAFLIPVDVTAENGEWSAEVNLTGKQVGTEFTVEVRHDGNTVADEDGVIQGEPIVQALTFEDQQSGGSSVVVQEAQLSDGGFVAIHEGSASGDILGTTRYLDAGEEAENIGVGLSSDVSDGDTLVAMPHMDEDSNERFNASTDGPYTENGSPVTESATISVGGGAGTPGPTPTPRVITATPGPTPTPRVVTVTQTPGQDGPGFGVVVALIALIAAALLAVRRNN